MIEKYMFVLHQALENCLPFACLLRVADLEKEIR